MARQFIATMEDVERYLASEIEDAPDFLQLGLSLACFMMKSDKWTERAINCVAFGNVEIVFDSEVQQLLYDLNKIGLAGLGEANRREFDLLRQEVIPTPFFQKEARFYGSFVDYVNSPLPDLIAEKLWGYVHQGVIGAARMGEQELYALRHHIRADFAKAELLS